MTVQALQGKQRLKRWVFGLFPKTVSHGANSEIAIRMSISEVTGVEILSLLSSWASWRSVTCVKDLRLHTWIDGKQRIPKKVGKGKRAENERGEQEGNNLHGKLKQIEIGKIVVHGKICNRRP